MTNSDNSMVLDATTYQTKIFLIEYIDTDDKDIETMQDNSNKLILNDYSVVVYVHGKLNFTIMMSFEANLLKNIANTFLSGENVEEREKKVIYYSVAKETLYIIAKLTLASCIKKGQDLDMELPIRINDAKSKEYSNKKSVSKNFTTKFGKFSINIINYNIKEDL